MIRKVLLKDQGISVSSDDVDGEIQKRCEMNLDNANEISKYYRKPSNKKRLSDELIDRKITEFLKQFAKIKTETIKTADLRKKELEHTHEH
jgi:Tfp pilus assembly PilM family ATPase